MEYTSLQNVLVENFLDGQCLNKSQVPEEIYNDWTSLLNDLFDNGHVLFKLNGWVEFSDLNKINHGDEARNYVSLITKLFSMVGDVNGFPLQKDRSLCTLFIAYAVQKPAENEMSLLKTKKAAKIFAYRVESCIARMILVQSAKTLQHLEADEFDLRISRRMRTKKKRRNLATAPDKKEASGGSSSPCPKPLDFTTLVVLCNSFKCNKQHDVEVVTALIDVISPAGIIFTKQVPAGYCKSCGIHFMLEHDFKDLQEEGVLLCQLISKKRYANGLYENLDGSKLKPESLLHQSGYNVSASTALTSIQRQEILKRVLDHKIYSQSNLLSFLDWLISKNQYTSSKDMSPAVQKWKSDRKFVANYCLDSSKKIHINKIHH